MTSRFANDVLLTEADRKEALSRVYYMRTPWRRGPAA